MSHTPHTLPHAASEEAGWRFDNTYLRLPDDFYSRTTPATFQSPKLAFFNRLLAAEMGLDPDAMETPDGAGVFSGNQIPQGAEPIAQAYAGHQFGNFTMLGDGRAILLGEQVTPDGIRLDVQLKGQGPTRYSRRGDGRAALGPMLREVIISEAIHALGIPTTRSLAVCATGEAVYRESALPGAVLTRIAASHIRVGTFEFAASLEDRESLVALTDYTLRRHYPECVGASNPALALLEAVISRQASLIAQWMLVGFVHGVMNTDNMAISGETIDYGPCAFLDAYDPSTVFSSIDRNGRYAYGNQPKIAHWNLSRFAETLLTQIHPDEKTSIKLATEALAKFSDQFNQCWLDGMRAKLGLFADEADDLALIDELLQWLATHGHDFTNTFRSLNPSSPLDPSITSWHTRWIDRLARQPHSIEQSVALMEKSNPVVIPRNHRVEEALTSAVEFDDFAPFEKLIAVLRRPFQQSSDISIYQLPPPKDSAPYRTFCGT
jgi:uncharacterized protein YdiU (UPF0061 family)